MLDDSAMMRTTLSRLRRNLAVVLGNSGDPGLADMLDRPGARRAARRRRPPRRRWSRNTWSGRRPSACE